ncbi:MAG TPA: hypothetical protein VN851_27040 [Thermoanaerobaculia bacterium]|nr:hypothetical protein [Thermoanaerobaculia bacterium]
MGLIKDWIAEMGSTWSGMAQGDANAFLGLPSTPQSTGHSNTGHLGGQPGTGSPNTGHPGGTLTAPQKKMLMQLFHQQYGRYPVSEFEYDQWLAANW